MAKRPHKNRKARVEVYEESDSEPEGSHAAKKQNVTLHQHTIIDASATGIRSRGATTRVLSSPLKPSRDPPPTVPRWLDDSFASYQASYGPDTLLSNQEDFTLQDYGVMDPELSAQWDDEHGLKDKRARTASDNPTQQWKMHSRDIYLDEMLRLEGRGDFGNGACAGCHAISPTYRCKACFGGELFCKECVVRLHVRSPLHVLQEWNGEFFERTTLKSLGLRIQLGHLPGIACVNPRPSSNDDFVIIDPHGVHEVCLDYCGCESAMSSEVQLLRASLYPATSVNPKSAASFRVLEEFHILSFESKCSGYEFYNSLARLTDNTGISPSRDRYDEFMRMALQWRHLKGLKRGGRGHELDGIDGTKCGELALRCPACPHPHINLPPEWKLAPEDDRYLYALFLGIDANFRLKRKKVSSEIKNPSLNEGWAFFVEESSYRAHLDKHWETPQERSTCVDHEAVNNPNKVSDGLAATGAVTIDCARHNFKRPNGVGDLQKGERYVNTDYVFVQSMRNSKVLILFVSYDVACQYFKNFWSRMNLFPQSERVYNGVRYIVWLVPKFHLPAHIQECNLQFSFNLTEGVGRTDGEAPERGWANINPLATSTKEMGPGSRRDTLDDHFNDWNWKKIVKLGSTLMKKIQDAVPARNEQILVHQDFEASMTPESIRKWTEMVEKWERDGTMANPYKPVRKTITAHSVRLELAKEVELMDANPFIDDGGNQSTSPEAEVHPSVMIHLGLQLEDDQCRLQESMKGLGLHSTSKQLANVTEHSNRLRRRIYQWSDIQQLHMPQARARRAVQPTNVGDDSTVLKAYQLPLHLPSSFKPRELDSLKLGEYEFKLREGLAYDCLHDMRQQLRIRAHVLKDKDRFSRGVRQNTRSQTTLKRIQAKIDHFSARYRTHRKAMLALSRASEDRTWMTSLRTLEDCDIRGLSEGLMNDTEGSRAPSWIWTMAGGPAQDGNDADMDEALRIEWCRSRARSRRFAEEVRLLQEEMRRTLAFLSWEVEMWTKRTQTGITSSSKRPDIQSNLVLCEGIISYAKRQAAGRNRLRERFASQWHDVDKFVQLANESLEM